MTQIIESLSEISDRYDAVFCDVWGCLHNGMEPFAEAVAALRAFRATGGTVVLVTNAPRAWADVAKQLDHIGVPRDSWDLIATSGDSARVAMFQGAVGDKVWFIGYERDLSVFDRMEILDDPVDVQRVPYAEATGIVCCGPEDPYADPEVYRPRFLHAKTRGLKLLCFNPDVIVDVGDRRQWCAGALARLYTEMGGESLYFGKPHPPIYDLARRRLTALGRYTPDSRILCIGDGIRTDVAGGAGEDFDVLFVSGGLAAAETRTDRQPDALALTTYLETENLDPAYTVGFLR